jgi:hypothetical protein
MKDYDTAKTACPYCGKPVNAAMALDGDRAPEVGDIAVCLKCRTIAVYQTNQTLRRTTDEERREISLLPVVIRTQLAIAGIKTNE